MAAEAGPDRPTGRMVVATQNLHKLRELAQMLDRVDLIPLPEGYVAPAETGETFAENAILKAEAANRATGEVALADDSGIAARALDGRPGVRSARYAGEDATDAENLEKLLEEVAAAGGDGRAEYVCVIAVAGIDAGPITFEGRCAGRLIPSPRGSGGFGYDPAFVPDETGPADDRTMAELPADAKNELSHRGKAMAALARHLSHAGLA